MVVEKVGYLKLDDVLKLKESGDLFSIYKTHKNTKVLVLNTKEKSFYLHYAIQDRLPYKVLEGKKIAFCEKVYSSSEDTEITTSGWNNDEQIMAYEEYCYF